MALLMPGIPPTILKLKNVLHQHSFQPCEADKKPLYTIILGDYQP